MKEKKPINLEIGQNVKQIRENAGLTQERLAELIGLGADNSQTPKREASSNTIITISIVNSPSPFRLFKIFSNYLTVQNKVRHNHSYQT